MQLWLLFVLPGTRIEVFQLQTKNSKLENCKDLTKSWGPLNVFCVIFEYTWAVNFLKSGKTLSQKKRVKPKLGPLYRIDYTTNTEREEFRRPNRE